MTKKFDNVPLETVLQWFNSNYEDAIHGFFFGEDGGYEYPLGVTPCSPLDVLEAEFPDVDPAVLQEAADILLSEGSAWVKKGVYPVV